MGEWVTPRAGCGTTGGPRTSGTEKQETAHYAESGHRAKHIEGRFCDIAASLSHARRCDSHPERRTLRKGE